MTLGVTYSVFWDMTPWGGGHVGTLAMSRREQRSRIALALTGGAGAGAAAVSVPLAGAEQLLPDVPCLARPLRPAPLFSKQSGLFAGTFCASWSSRAVRPRYPVGDSEPSHSQGLRCVGFPSPGPRPLARPPSAAFRACAVRVAPSQFVSSKHVAWLAHNLMRVTLVLGARCSDATWLHLPIPATACRRAHLSRRS